MIFSPLTTGERLGNSYIPVFFLCFIPETGRCFCQREARKTEAATPAAVAARAPGRVYLVLVMPMDPK